MSFFRETLDLFDRAIVKGLTFFLMEAPLDNPEEEARRWEICKSNKGKCYNASNDRCNFCHCKMESKVKMLRHVDINRGGRITITHCPLAKWYGEEEEILVNYYKNLNDVS
jgi:hypothetical protein